MLTQKSDKKLFLLDAYALIYRAYFAFAKNPRINSKGQNTSAAFGFTNALIDVIRNEKPNYIAVVFDPPGGSLSRRVDFEAYKAHREEMPEDIRSMIGPIKEIIKAFCIPILEVNGYEADDVIGTLAKIAEKKGYLTYMMTPDKDFGQLVSPNIFMYKPGRGGNPAEVWGVREVCDKFEIDDPIKVIDILGLWGDAADNIPGIPGIGEKTAKKLLSEYGSLENLLQHADDLNGKMKENIINYADQGLLSKQLATIITDVDVAFNEEDLLICEPDPEKIKTIFTELEFRGLAKRVIGEEIEIKAQAPGIQGQMDLFGSQSMIENIPESSQSSKQTLATGRPKYHLVSTDEERKELLRLLLSQTEVCFDTETDSLNSLHANLVGIAFSFKKNEGYYMPTPNDYQSCVDLLADFKPFFESEKIEKIGHNIKYDRKVLNRYHIRIAAPCFDTMIAHYLIQPDSKQGMDYLAEQYLNYKAIPIEELIGKKGKGQRSMADLLPSDIKDYACEDADITLRLKKVFEPEINREHLKRLFYDLEMPLEEVLAAMEIEGIRIDTANLRAYSADLEVSLSDLESAIYKEAGTPFNIDSPKQLGDVLFDHLKIGGEGKIQKTKTGQYATGEDILQKLKHQHAIIPLILDYRQLRKLKSTYVDPLPELADPEDGRIHTNFMQTVTSTGRLSSNNPNLQNIPIRSEKGKEIRRAFIPRSSDYLIMAADYSQIELRIIATLSKDENMIDAFKSGQDIHAATAARVYGVPLEEVSREQRSNAKAVNFGIIYGQSSFGLAQNLNISRTDAKQIIDSYFEQYPGIKRYMVEAISEARSKGYVETIMRRRRYLSDINSANAMVRGFAERNAINAPIQGSAADIIKQAMIAIHAKMKKAKMKSRLLLQVHDELVFDVHKEELQVLQKLVKHEMEHAVEFAVPLDVEIGTGTNWLDAH